MHLVLTGSAFRRRRFLVFSSIVVAVLSTAVLVGRPPIIASDSTTHLPEATSSTTEAVSIHLRPFASGLNRPVGIANAGDYRLFVIEQNGTIRVVEADGSLHPEPFLDVRGRVASSGFERGLLGLAFHPSYHQNGYFYVNYTHLSDRGLLTRISRFRVTANAYVADPTSELILLTVAQPFGNHNAGKILFGPDGYLYIPLGDGGSAGDPHANAQNPRLLLGKVSRIDVDSGPGSAQDCFGDGTGAYTVPADNPFVDGPGDTCDEIWASGLRNPWQSSFDSETGHLFMADVGQDKIEEVDFQPASSSGGENYGWNCYEGSEPYVANQDPSNCDSAEAYTFPIFEYANAGSTDCSVTGGYVYRGQKYPALSGRYLLTDYCSGRFWDLEQLPDGSWRDTEHNDTGLMTRGNAAFGERCDGELFVANVILGELHQVTDRSSSVPAISNQVVIGSFVPEAWVYLPLVSAGCR